MKDKADHILTTLLGRLALELGSVSSTLNCLEKRVTLSIKPNTKTSQDLHKALQNFDLIDQKISAIAELLTRLSDPNIRISEQKIQAMIADIRLEQLTLTLAKGGQATPPKTQNIELF